MDYLQIWEMVKRVMFYPTVIIVAVLVIVGNVFAWRELSEKFHTPWEKEETKAKKRAAREERKRRRRQSVFYR